MHHCFENFRGKEFLKWIFLRKGIFCTLDLENSIDELLTVYYSAHQDLELLGILVSGLTA